MTWASAGRKIWNGPFYVGRLERPITFGEALLKLLEVAWRIVVTIVGSAIAAGLALYLVITWWPKLFPPLNKRLVTIAQYDPRSCAKGFPVLVTIRNPTKTTIGSVNVHLAARLPGHSTDLNVSEYSRDFDIVMKPYQIWQWCLKANGLPDGSDEAALVYTADVGYVEEYTGPDVTKPMPPVPTITAPPIRLAPDNAS